MGTVLERSGSGCGTLPDWGPFAARAACDSSSAEAPVGECVIETSTDLLHWTPLKTMAGDSMGTGSPARTTRGGRADALLPSES